MFQELYHHDIRRIDGYLDQFAASKSSVLNWSKFELGIKWPVELLVGAESGEKEKKNVFKKIKKLKKLMEDTNQIAFFRPDGIHIEQPFVSETCNAIRVSIPRAGDEGKAALSFWLSEKMVGKPERRSRLCLIEDFREGDGKAINFQYTSEYSLLVSLVYYARDEISKSTANADIPDEPFPNPYARFGTEKHPMSLSQWENSKACMYDFIENPSALFARWRCKVSMPHEIEVVYRVREWGPEAARSNADISVFGYPLWILGLQL